MIIPSRYRGGSLAGAAQIGYPTAHVDRKDAAGPALNFEAQMPIMDDMYWDGDDHMTLVLNGTWEEIRAHDAELTGKRVQLIVDDAENNSTSQPLTEQMITLGMFPQLLALSDQDFSDAEYHDDGTDWQ